jgi:chromosome segregation protein
LQQVCRNAEQALAEARSATSQSERTAQQAKFDREIIEHKIYDLGGSIGSLQESQAALLAQRAECESSLAVEAGATSRDELEQVLEAKHGREQDLADARNRMSETDQQLQDHDRQRLQIEHELQPLRSRLEQGRLQEQQARLHFDYCVTELAASGGEHEALEQGLPASAKPALMEQQAAEIEAQIEQLGAVNLAAMQELESERERDAYLGSQAQDLTEAMETLKDAIRRIDRETRERLQQTFEEANRQFGELFRVLFGGGQARLELLGEEILDTGVQVFAQPPGKKNTTIHLLSGGEKALTAIALVFALFKLNPAPFCLMDEVDAPLDDSNTDRFCEMVKKMSDQTQILFVSHNKITMEMAQQLIGVTMQESGVSRIVEVDIDAAIRDLFKGSQDNE